MKVTQALPISHVTLSTAARHRTQDCSRDTEIGQPTIYCRCRANAAESVAPVTSRGALPSCWRRVRVRGGPLCVVQEQQQVHRTHCEVDDCGGIVLGCTYVKSMLFKQKHAHIMMRCCGTCMSHQTSAESVTALPLLLHSALLTLMMTTCTMPHLWQMQHSPSNASSHPSDTRDATGGAGVAGAAAGVCGAAPLVLAGALRLWRWWAWWWC
jgi:hypothetical protein